MRKFFVAPLALMLTLAGLNACAGSSSASDTALRKTADAKAISDLEVIFHRSASTKDIDTMMTLFADNATFRIGGQTYTGKEQIRNFILSTASFQPQNHWVSVTPAYKLRTNSTGDQGTLYFECHYVDVDSKVVKAAVSADIKLNRVKGHWVFMNLNAAPATLS
jgi:hypothetical protein